MTDPVAYLNGEYLSISKATLSVFDLGVVAGASVTEMVRTFRHIPFRLSQHLDRLDESLAYLNIDCPVSRQELLSICEKVVGENSRLIPIDHDLGLIIFVTAGQNLTYLGRSEIKRAKSPTLCVHTFPLPFELWADRYSTGVHLVTTSVRSMPDDVISPAVKHRNRLHWQIADAEARRMDPTAMALLLDQDGYLTETGTGNLCIVDGGTILTPAFHVLRGISRSVVAELAASIGISMGYIRLRPDDLERASEAFLTSTPHCLLPVTNFNGEPIGRGVAGPIFQRLIAAWSDMVGVDIIAQMENGAKTREIQE
jgi:branched-chain amino acid aminotransferase